MKNIEIRETLPEDAEKVIAYIKKIGGETDYLTFGEEGLPITLEEEKEYLRQVQADRGSVYYSAWRGEKMIGAGSLSGLLRRMSHRGEAAVSVIKDEWNQGIGSMLLEKLIAYARENEIEFLDLTVRRDHASAIRLYEKCGFQRVGTIPAYFKIEDRYYDAVAMYLDLRG